MSDGNRSQARILLIAVDLNFALQNAPCCRAAQRFVRLVHAGQQLDVGPCVQLRETPSPIDRRLHPPGGRVARDQPRALRTAQPSHLLDVAPRQAPRRLAQVGVLLSDQHLLHPAIELPPIFTLKPDFLAGLDEPAHRLQTQLLCIVHADVHIPA